MSMCNRFKSNFGRFRINIDEQEISGLFIKYIATEFAFVACLSRYVQLTTKISVLPKLQRYVYTLLI